MTSTRRDTPNPDDASADAAERAKLANALGAAGLLSSLFDGTLSRVLVLDEQMVVLDANAMARKWLAPSATEGVRGKRLDQLLPHAVARERSELARTAMREHRVVLAEGMIAGMWTHCTYLPFDRPTANTTPEGNNHQAAANSTLGMSGVMWVITPLNETVITEDRHAPDPHSRAEMPRTRASADDLGPLGKLTARELQVLRLIGLGYSAAEMSEALHRSEKTIQGHRLSLGAKLNIGGRVSLSRLAVRSGITMLDESELTVIARKASAQRAGS